VDPSKVMTGFAPSIFIPAANVANSETDNVPCTVVNEPDAEMNGVPVAHETTSVKLVFIWDATIDVPALNELVTFKAATNGFSLSCT
jgi:hypothetical protein